MLSTTQSVAQTTVWSLTVGRPQMRTELEKWRAEGYRSVGFLGGERGVGDARLGQPEGHLVPAAEQADGEEGEGGRERT